MQWLIGMTLLVFAGLLLYALDGSKTSAGESRMAKSDACLQAAGSDLKRGALMYHDMASRPCGCTAAN